MASAFKQDKYTKKAIDQVRKGVSFFITGKAGTGKTTLLKKIVAECRAKGKNVAVTAPTGVAAKNAEGKTMHSMFGIRQPLFIPGKMPLKPRLNPANEMLVKNLDILIIDEISMVRCDLLDMVDLTLQHYKRNKKPFGGVQVIVFGDLFQLPPVVEDDDKDLLYSHYNNEYFFASDVIKKYQLPILELNRVHRQEDPIFVNILNNIRIGKYLSSDFATLNKRLNPEYEPSEKESAIFLRTRNYTVDKHNKNKLLILPGVEECFKAYIDGTFPEKQYPTEKVLKLKVGAKVMLLRNDNDGLKYVNGTIGFISSIFKDSIRILTEEGLLITVERSVWEYYDYEYDKETDTIKPIVIGTFKQFPLRLAWAVTIHKSQGMTFEKAIVDAKKAFAPGLVYVALSRCRTLEGLTLTSRIKEEDVYINQHVIDYLRDAEYISDVIQNTADDSVSIYILTDEGKTITGCTIEASGTIEIPESVNRIKDDAFKDNTNITELVCNKALKEIGHHAFFNCTNLNKVTLNKGLTSIGTEAFYCTNLKKITIPSTVDNIGVTPFKCRVKVDKKNLHFADIDGILYNKDITSLVLYPSDLSGRLIDVPSTVETVQAYAFENCEAKEIILPESIIELQSSVFSGCQNLTEITLKSNNPEKLILDENAFSGFEVERSTLKVPFASLSKYKKDERFKDFKNITAIEGSPNLIYDPKGISVVGVIDNDSDTDIIIPEGVISVENESFKENKKIKAVRCPSTLKSIGNNAFNGCTNLSKADLNKGLKTIGEDAFNFTNLGSVYIPNTVTNIGRTAFACYMVVAIGNPVYTTKDGVLYSHNMKNLVRYPSGHIDKEFTVPTTVTTISDFAFSCSKLSKIHLPNSLLEIGDAAFILCTNLNTLLIRDSIEKVGSSLFIGCNNLKNVTFESKNPEYIEIDEDAFADFEEDSCVLTVPTGCKQIYSSLDSFAYFSKICELTTEATSITGYITGMRYEELPGYRYKDSKPFFYYSGEYHCYIVMTQLGFFLKVINDGYYFLSDSISDNMNGSIWIQNKKDKLSSYDFSYSTDNRNGTPVGHIQEFSFLKSLSYTDYKTKKSFTIQLGKYNA